MGAYLIACDVLPAHHFADLVLVQDAIEYEDSVDKSREVAFVATGIAFTDHQFAARRESRLSALVSADHLAVKIKGAAGAIDSQGHVPPVPFIISHFTSN